MTKPASRSRAATGASSGIGDRSRAAVPIGIGVPRVAMFSLIVPGTPSSGSACPFIQRASEAFAAARAASGS